jgi:hypothetical protein
VGARRNACKTEQVPPYHIAPIRLVRLMQLHSTRSKDNVNPTSSHGVKALAVQRLLLSNLVCTFKPLFWKTTIARLVGL